MPDAQRCEHTRSAEWTGLPSGTTSIEVIPAPSAFATSADRQFRVADWAAVIEVPSQPPLLAACVYSSDSEVYCDADESPTP
jgi:hypothetical protein